MELTLSIPFATPPVTIKQVIAIKTNVHSIGSNLRDENSEKYSALMLASVTLLIMYRITQPPTTQ